MTFPFDEQPQQSQQLTATTQVERRRNLRMFGKKWNSAAFRDYRAVSQSFQLLTRLPFTSSPDQQFHLYGKNLPGTTTSRRSDSCYLDSNSMRICTSSSELLRSRWTSKSPSPHVVIKLHTCTPSTSVIPDSVGLLLESRMTCQ